MSPRIIFFLIAIFSGIWGRTQVPIQPNMVPYYSFKTKLWGVSDTNAKLIIPVKYENIKLPYSTLAVGEPVYPSGQYHGPVLPSDIYKSDGTYVISATSIGDNHEGFVVIQKDRQFGLIDTSGNILIPAKYDHMYNVNEGKVVCKSGETNYLFNTQGNLITSTDTCEISPFDGGSAWVRSKSGRIGSMDPSGKIFWCPQQYPVMNFRGRGLITVQKKEGDYSGLIDCFGKEIIPLQYVNISPQYSVIFVEREGKKGFYNRSGKMLLAAEYDKIEWVRCNVTEDNSFRKGWSYDSRKFMVVTKNNMTGVVDTNGKVIVPVEYAYIRCMNEGVFTVSKQKPSGEVLMGFIDSTGKVIAAPNYTRATSYIYGVAFVNEGSGFRMMDRSGKFINNEIYTSPGKPNNQDFDSLFHLSQNGKYGVITSIGTVKIPFLYDFIWKNGGRNIVKQGKLYGTISDNGEIIWPVKFSWIGCYYDGYGWAKIDSNFVIVDSLGKVKPLMTGCAVNATSIYNGLCPSGCILAKCNGRSVWMNSKGDTIPELQAYESAQFMPDHIRVFKDGKHGVLDRNFKVLLPLEERTVVNRRTATIFNVYIGSSKGANVFENVNGVKYYEL